MSQYEINFDGHKTRLIDPYDIKFYREQELDIFNKLRMTCLPGAYCSLKQVDDPVANCVAELFQVGRVLGSNPLGSTANILDHFFSSSLKNGKMGTRPNI